VRRRFVRKNILAVAFLAFSSVLAAQQALNNDAVIKLVKAGLSDDLIVSAIKAKPGSYDTSTDGIIALKTGGASDKVVAAILGKAPAPAAPLVTVVVASNAALGTNPDDPAAAHEAGIYIYNDSAPAGSKMVLLEPNVYSSSKTGGVFASAMTYGIAKMKMKAVLRGAHANARVADSRPVFYFYFEQKSAGLSGNLFGIFSGTSTPNEFTLLHFDIKGETRETVTSKISLMGSSEGTDDKAVTPFTYTRLRPGVYKVSLNSPLQPGEYGFISSGGSRAMDSMGGRVFDFGRN
jgi:hypothetical protein